MSDLWKKRIALSLSSLLFCVFLLLLFEVGVRLFGPTINFQGTEMSLQRQRAFGSAHGWVPNARGLCFGKQVEIDEFGFRKQNSPQEYDSSWLILGDSVTFGVGVDGEDTYIQLLQNELNRIKVWNTSVIGYDVDNYRSVLNHFLVENQQIPNIKKVILLFCLNDVDLVEGNSHVQAPSSEFTGKILSLLGRNSKSYILLKDTVSDRSKSYYQHDSRLYDDSTGKFTKAMRIMSEIQATLRTRNIDFSVVILPYEYQLRMKGEPYLLPQKRLAQYFRENGIRYIDAYEYFERAGLDTKETFLYADFCHLSKTGHQIMANLLKEHYKAE